jgi:Zn-dependent membrane protease YugP
VFYDEYYLMLVLPAFLIALWAQAKVQATFSKYSKVQTSADTTYSQIKVRVKDMNKVVDVQNAIKEMGFQTYSLMDQMQEIQKTSRIIQAVLGGTDCRKSFSSTVYSSAFFNTERKGSKEGC